MSGAESQLRVIRVDSAVSKLRPLILRERRQGGHRERSHLCHFRKWEAIPFLTHEHMLYRLGQLLQAGHAEVSICKMGSFGAIGRHCILNSARRFSAADSHMS
jgi:hypothetical protein